MTISFCDESGTTVRDEWQITDPTETVPCAGDRILMDSGDVAVVVGRTFFFTEGSDGKRQSVMLILRAGDIL